MKGKTMEEARTALMWHMGHWVTPVEVLHDGGTEFTNAAVRELFAACGVKDINLLEGRKQFGREGEQGSYASPQKHSLPFEYHDSLARTLGDNNENNESPEEGFIFSVTCKYSLWGSIS